VTNYGTCAILALPRLPERQLRFLLALETFSRGDDGWREAGMKLLAKTAGRSPNTAIKARDELVAAGAIEYRPGNGRGNHSSYRIKVPGIGDHLRGKVPKSAGKVPKNAGYLPSPERYPNGPRKGTQTGRVKVPKRNAVTSANANAALKPSALDTSALPARARVRDLLRAEDATVTEDIAAEVIKIIERRGVRDPVAVAVHEISVLGNGHGLIHEARHNADRAQWQREEPRVKQDDPARYDPTDVVAGIRKELSRKREERDG
jgi:hypothetical protein